MHHDKAASPRKHERGVKRLRQEEDIMRPVRRGIAFALLIWLALPLCHARAQSWPTRPVTLIVPFPAGGNADVLARAVAAELSKKLGQSFIVDNRSGAGGNIGGAAVAK